MVRPPYTMDIKQRGAGVARSDHISREAAIDVLRNRFEGGGGRSDRQFLSLLHQRGILIVIERRP